MWILPALLLGQFALCQPSITFPNTSDANEVQRIHDFYQPSPLVDSVAYLGIHAVTELLSSHKNVIISPLNIFSCLDILQLGAAGATKEEVRLRRTSVENWHLEGDSINFRSIRLWAMPRATIHSVKY